MSETEVAAYDRLRAHLYEHLDEAEFLALQYGDWTGDEVDSARRLIPDLVDVIRAMLTEHREAPTRQCRSCRGPWPCATVEAVHRMLTAPDREFHALLLAAQD